MILPTILAFLKIGNTLVLFWHSSSVMLVYGLNLGSQPWDKHCHTSPQWGQSECHEPDHIHEAADLIETLFQNFVNDAPKAKASHKKK